MHKNKEIDEYNVTQKNFSMKRNTDFKWLYLRANFYDIFDPALICKDCNIYIKVNELATITVYKYICSWSTIIKR